MSEYKQVVCVEHIYTGHFRPVKVGMGKTRALAEFGTWQGHARGPLG